MARSVVPFVVMLALVGGYVLGQQPTSAPDAPRTHRVRNIDPAAARWLVGKMAPPAPTGQVGRYASAGEDRLLDTADGTLYRLDGDRWHVLATIAHGEAAVPEAAVQRAASDTTPAPAGDNLLESLDTKIRENRENVARLESALQNVTSETTRASLDQARERLLDRIEELENLKARLHPAEQR